MTINTTYLIEKAEEINNIDSERKVFVKINDTLCPVGGSHYAEDGMYILDPLEKDEDNSVRMLLRGLECEADDTCWGEHHRGENISRFSDCEIMFAVSETEIVDICNIEITDEYIYLIA